MKDVEAAQEVDLVTMTAKTRYPWDSHGAMDYERTQQVVANQIMGLYLGTALLNFSRSWDPGQLAVG